MYDTASLQQNAVTIAQEYGLDPAFFSAQIQQESAWDPNAVSTSGCKGIAQICDAVSFDPFDPNASMQYMAQRMSNALQAYGGNKPAALASYNCGNGCADAWVKSGAPISALPGETQAYIHTILGGGATSPATSQSLSGANASAPGGANAFTPVALSAQATSLIVVFAVLVMLIGVAAASKKGGYAHG